MALKQFVNSMRGNNNRPSSLGSNIKAEEVKNQPSSLGDNISEQEVAEEVQKPEAANSEQTCELKEKQTPIVYNLIILDESGSMSCVTRQTITGCNETLNGIRSIAKQNPEQKQFVSIFCFDTSNSRYLFENKPIEDVKEELTERDYRPNACTPLYDAIGYTVTKLKRFATDSNSVGKVTIITDGYENASTMWSHAEIVKLIESLKQKGWIFTFIGANIDVEATSRSLGIDSFMEFEQSEEGMHRMFARERASNRAYSKKMAYMRKMESFENASECHKEEMLHSLNCNYFTEFERVAPDRIRTLEADQIFVFGSNIAGNHNGSAAEYAVKKFGAVMGQAEGLQGQSYAIPSVGVSIAELTAAIERFTEFAARNAKYKFMLTAIGCGNAGYTPEQIAPLFKTAYQFGNVYVPASFLPYVKEEDDNTPAF